jgi:regulatory protein
MRRKRIFRSKDSTNEALQYALRLINIRDRTEQELIDRLRRKGFCEETIMATVDRLKQSDLIDDRRAAEALINYGAKIKGLGARGLRRFCLEKGIDETLADELITEDDDEQRAEELVIKRLASMTELSTLKKYQRLYGYLYRRGYPPETIKKVLRKHLRLEA